MNKMSVIIGSSRKFPVLFVVFVLGLLGLSCALVPTVSSMPSATTLAPTDTLEPTSKVETATYLPPTPTSMPIRPLEIASSHELCVIKNPPTIATRDGGASALIGGKLIWLFGDTIFPVKSVDGTNGRSNTAAWADPTSPCDITEPLDANGAPYQFLPYTPEEQAYNDSTGRPDDRIALWPGSVIPDGEDAGIVFYLKLRVKGALDYEYYGIGLAHFEVDSTVAVREPDLLFTYPEPNFNQAMIVGDEVYVYGNINNWHENEPVQPVAVARAPLAEVSNREAYQFWNGTDWVSDVKQVKPIFGDVPGELSVSYNPYLHQFLATHAGIFTDKVFMRVASSPEGPWSPPVEAFMGITPGEVLYAGREHPELMSNGGRTVIVSYYWPRENFQGELRLVEINFR